MFPPLFVFVVQEWLLLLLMAGLLFNSGTSWLCLFKEGYSFWDLFSPAAALVNKRSLARICHRFLTWDQGLLKVSDDLGKCCTEAAACAVLHVHSPFLRYLLYRDWQVYRPKLPHYLVVGDDAWPHLDEWWLWIVQQWLFIAQWGTPKPSNHKGVSSLPSINLKVHLWWWLTKSNQQFQSERQCHWSLWRPWLWLS